MGRTCVNVVGNCLATVVVARWEGDFPTPQTATAALESIPVQPLTRDLSN